MKNFFASMLGTLTGLVIFALGGSLLVVGLIIAVAASGDAAKVEQVEKGSYLVLDLSVNIVDTPPQADGAALIASLTGDEVPAVWQLRQFTRVLREAARDERIAGVFIIGQFAPEGYGTGYAALREARAALIDFKASKKPVLAYLESASIRETYLASVADEFVLDPYGMVMLQGLASQPVHFAGALEKFGVGVQVTRVGKYKSAIEPFVRRDMSPESREQMQKLLDDLWSELRAGIATGRGLTPAQIQALTDSEGFIMPALALKSGIVDKLAYRDEVIDTLKARTGRKGQKEPFKQVKFASYAESLGDDEPELPATPEKPAGGSQDGRIAVVYAEGAIVDGRGELGEVGGERFAREIRRLRQDADVKAIVLLRHGLGTHPA